VHVQVALRVNGDAFLGTKALYRGKDTTSFATAAKHNQLGPRKTPLLLVAKREIPAEISKPFSFLSL